MWKVLIAFFFSSSITNGYSQEKQNELAKYSYQVQLTRQCSTSQALGFFVRYEQRLFFVTTSQCVTGWDPLAAQTATALSDTLFVRLSADTSKVTYLPLPVAQIKKTARRYSDVDAPEIYVMEVKNPRKYKVFSIEDFFEEDVPCELAKQVVVVGLPELKRTGLAAEEFAESFRFNTSLDASYCNYPYLPDVKTYDKLHYVASFKENMADQVLSGAPAYLVTDNESIVFGGVYIGSSRGAVKTGRIIRPEFVLNEIIARISER